MRNRATQNAANARPRPTKRSLSDACHSYCGSVPFYIYPGAGIQGTDEPFEEYLIRGQQCCVEVEDDSVALDGTARHNGANACIRAPV